MLGASSSSSVLLSTAQSISEGSCQSPKKETSVQSQGGWITWAEEGRLGATPGLVALSLHQAAPAVPGCSG